MSAIAHKQSNREVHDKQDLNIFLSYFFQETYSTRLYERYWDDPSTCQEIFLDLWLDAGSNGGPDRNWVYGIPNTTTKDIRVGRSVSIVGNSQSGSSQ